MNYVFAQHNYKNVILERPLGEHIQYSPSSGFLKQPDSCNVEVYKEIYETI